jgi:hypothetical protein
MLDRKGPRHECNTDDWFTDVASQYDRLEASIGEAPQSIDQPCPQTIDAYLYFATASGEVLNVLPRPRTIDCPSWIQP